MEIYKLKKINEDYKKRIDKQISKAKKESYENIKIQIKKYNKIGLANAREFLILDLRLKGLCLEDIADIFNITKERVRQIEVKACERLNKYIKH
jgi:DNA-directed RNA polymerase sigma subunit (sigma70/sigma32)